MTVIDLGEVGTANFEPPRPPILVARRLIRQVTAAVVALLTLVTVTASAPTPEPRGLRPLWSAPLNSVDTMFLSGDTVFLNRLNDNQDRATLTAYDADTGAVRWSADAGPVVSYPDLITGAGVVMQPVAMAEFRTGVTTNSSTGTTAALDGATGARLWQMDASTVHAAGDMVLMAEHDTHGRATKVRMVRVHDGGTVWSRAVVANSAVAASDDVVVTVDDHGTLTVLRWADGSVLHTRKVPWTPDRPTDGVHNEVTFDAGALVLGQSNQRNNRSVVYRLDTLAESWRSNAYVGDCGTVLCSAEGGGAVGRDPLTGAERWRLPGVQNVFPIGSGRLLAETASETAGPQLIDAATGRTVASLGPGQLLWTWGQQSPIPSRLLMLSNAVLPPLHVTVTQVDRATGQQFVLGALDWLGDGNSGGCQAGSRYLICPGHDRVYVTAVG